jgi:hypothetical protein
MRAVVGSSQAGVRLLADIPVVGSLAVAGILAVDSPAAAGIPVAGIPAAGIPELAVAGIPAAGIPELAVAGIPAVDSPAAAGIPGAGRLAVAGTLGYSAEPALADTQAAEAGTAVPVPGRHGVRERWLREY